MEQTRDIGQITKEEAPRFIGKAMLGMGVVRTAPIYYGAELVRVESNKANYFVGKKPSTNGYNEIPADATEVRCYFKTSGAKDIGFGYEGSRIHLPKKRNKKEF